MARKKSARGGSIFGKVEPKRVGGAEGRNPFGGKQSQVDVTAKAGRGKRKKK